MSVEPYIDLNADLGESVDALADGRDAELMRYVTSANVACGAHAGDAETIRRTIESAKSLQVAVGAHPGYPDRENFGRTELAIGAEELRRSLREQIELVRAIAARVGTRVVHVKPHGALYHSVNHRHEIARMVAEVVAEIDTAMIMVAQCGSAALSIYKEAGLRTAAEAFADRAYEPDGELRNRKLAGALLEVPELAAKQAVEIATQGSLKVGDSGTLRLTADTLCLHSDTPGAAMIARAVREGLERAGVRVSGLK